MPDDMMKRYLRCINNPQGMIVFTGPTGSGKTTTLYCTLDILRKQSLKIITAEDPIEYQFDGIQQCQVHEQIGNTFAKYLRGFLRQDPDAILIGEIRDQDTAVMATRAAVTGHLLFTTIHATDSVGVVRRLIDMGVDSSMLSMSLLGVVYQRLMRRICAHCKTEYREEPAVLEDLQLSGVFKDMPLYKGVGCESCDQEGYHGRVAVYEFWELTEEAKDSLSKDPDDRKIRQAAIQMGLKPLVVDAVSKVRQGVTTLAELQQVIPYNQILKVRDYIK
jgi:type II secretory ATPase GspE/PulE/Tfp pilus assembly ATPase PilB-like protein